MAEAVRICHEPCVRRVLFGMSALELTIPTCIPALR